MLDHHFGYCNYLDISGISALFGQNCLQDPGLDVGRIWLRLRHCRRSEDVMYRLRALVRRSLATLGVAMENSAECRKSIGAV